MTFSVDQAPLEGSFVPPLRHMFTADDLRNTIWWTWYTLPFTAYKGLQYTGLLSTYWHIYTGIVIMVVASIFTKLPVTPHLWGEEVVVVTGGATGLGAAIAQQLVAGNLRKHVKVVILTIQPLDFKDDTGRIFTYMCDVSKRSEVFATAEKIRQEVGHPTMVINNAGVVKGKLLLDLTERDIHSTFGVNTLAAYWTTQAFLPHMLRTRRGHIVNISSVLGLITTAQNTDYCASKAGMISFHGSLRAELDYRYCTREVKTTLVCPGHIMTKLFAKLHFRESSLCDLLMSTISPEDLASAIISSIEAGKVNDIIRLPNYTKAAPLIRPGSILLPSPLYRFLLWASSTDWSMADFAQRPDSGECLAMERTDPDYKAAF